MTSRPNDPRAGAECGFTLVELMIALVILTIGLLALSGVQTRSSHDVHTTGRHTRALALAEEHLEVTRGGGYAAADSANGVSGPFTWVTIVDSVAVDLKRVVVTVTWNESNAARSLQLNTLLSAR